MTESKIYGSGVEAFSYVAIFFFSNLIPIILTSMKAFNTDYSTGKADENASLLFLSIFINAAAILRENLILYKNKNVSTGFWIKRFLCTATSFSSLVLVSSLIFFMLSEKTSFGLYLQEYINLLKTICYICAILLSLPIMIASFEGVEYIVNDFNNSARPRWEKKLVNKYLLSI